MRPAKPRVKLQDLLRDALALLPVEDKGDHASAVASVPSTFAVTRTPEDRSRMLKKVSEKLAKKQALLCEGGANSPAANHAVTQPDLFGDVRNDRTCQIFVQSSQAHRKVANDVRLLVLEVYRSMFRLAPEDYVVIDPSLNAEFIARCRLRGATTSEYLLNRTLLNIRKSGWNSDLCREAVPAPDRAVLDRYIHAAEIAGNLIQRGCAMFGRLTPSVDHILCDPELRNQFDVFVCALSGEVDPVVARLSLLAFRKSGRAAATGLTSICIPPPSLSAPFRSLDLHDVPPAPGVYRLLCKKRPVFVAATLSLKDRISTHLTYGGTGLLPEELPFVVDAPLSIELFPSSSEREQRSAETLARSLRLHQHPALNLQSAGALFNERDCIHSRRSAAG